MDPIAPVFETRLQEWADQGSLKQVFAGFVGLLPVSLRLFDAEGDLVVEHTAANPACAYLATLPRSRERCVVIRQQVKNTRPDGRGEPVSVTCFCGLEYLVYPVRFQSEVVGTLAFGPFLPKELQRLPRTLAQVEPQVQPAAITAAMGELPRVSRSHARRWCATVLTVLDAVFASAHKAYVTAQMHTAMVRESYREIAEQNRKLEEMVEEKKEFDRHKSNFLAMVSHELRTPLTSIIGYSDMLTEGIAGELPEEQRQFVQTIKAKGEELLKIISSILDFTKIDSGRLTVSPAPCSVPDIIAKAVAKVDTMARKRGIAVRVEVAGDVPTVFMDPEKIVTSLFHLLDNAIKFSMPGGTVQVTARVVASNEDDASEDGFGFVLLAVPDMLEIAVEDFGVGIATDDVDALFAPFTQADESSTREHGGAGLGLAIVKQYVEAHGGRVLVESRPGEGSRFSVRIPIVDTPTA